MDNPRILDLRRRVQADPSSIVFAQLGEELRRAGANEEAIEVCTAGLTRHPGYLSARVTLGRALIELDRLDEARGEFRTVVTSAPDNLAAIRGLAEIHQRRGEIGEALVYYRRALELARHDPDLEETVERMEKQVAPPPPPEPTTAIEELFDFDRLVEQLGAETPPAVDALDKLAAALDAQAAAAPGEAVADPFAPPEPADETTAGAAAAADDTQAPAADAPQDTQALGQLEDWLAALRSTSR